MGVELPPVDAVGLAKLKGKLARMRPCDREDAVQEAWAAHLSGKSPTQAVKRYGQREHDYREKCPQILDDDNGGHTAIDRDGTKHKI